MESGRFLEGLLLLFCLGMSYVLTASIQGNTGMVGQANEVCSTSPEGLGEKRCTKPTNAVEMAADEVQLSKTPCDCPDHSVCEAGDPYKCIPEAVVLAVQEDTLMFDMGLMGEDTN